jgi:hypothetical protein
VSGCGGIRGTSSFGFQAANGAAGKIIESGYGGEKEKTQRARIRETPYTQTSLRINLRKP